MNKNNITEGVIWKQLLYFFFPILIGTFFQQMYNTADAVILGRYAGKEALSSAGGSAGQVVSLVVGFFVGLTSGAAVVVSQLYGAQNKKKLSTIIHTSYAFSAIGGIVLAVAGIICSESLLRVMKTPETLMESSTVYLKIYFLGIIFVFIYNMGASIIRALGDSRRPLYYLIAGTAINIMLDIIFIVYLKMGVRGAAYATVLAQMVSAVLVTLRLSRIKEEYSLDIKSIRIHKDMLAAILKIGLPTAVQASMYNISNMIVQASLNRLGVDVMAAWTAYGKIDCILWMIVEAFGISITTFVGQNYGAGKFDRIKKGTLICLIMTAVSCVVYSLVIIPNGPVMFHIFVNDQNVVETGMRMMMCITPAYFLFAFIEVLSGTLRAEGYVLVPTLITVLGVCVVRIIWILIIVPEGTLEQIAYCYPITWIISAICVIAYYMYRQKKVYACCYKI